MSDEIKARNDRLPDSLESPPRHHSVPRETLPPGFRNMFVDPDDPPEIAIARRYRGLGTTAQTMPLLQAVALRMMRDGFGTNDERQIPAGFTYLFQLVSHDLQFTARKDLPPPTPVRNLGSDGWLHRRRLMLETAYGLGPEESPALFETNANGSILFRLSSKRAPEQGASDWRRDLPRNPLAAADVRNDENPLVAQSTALFLQLHNHATRKLETHGTTPEQRFAAAQLVTRFIYREILFSDLLRQLIRDDIRSLYTEGRASLDRFQFPDETSGSMEVADHFPVEVSHAAIRTGHALTRGSYTFDAALSLPNPKEIGIADLLGLTSSRGGPDMRVWMVPWPKLVAQDGLLAQPFCPHMNPNLSEADPLRIEPGSEFQADLILRDLARGMDGGQLRVDAVAESIGPFLVDKLRADGWLATDEEMRRSAVRAWADNAGGASLKGVLADVAPGWDDAGLEQAVQSFISDPPLLFFLLLEAAAPADQGGGAKKPLGAMGSIILAECLFGARLLTETQVETHSDLERWLKLAFGVDVPRTLEALVRLLESQT